MLNEQEKKELERSLKMFFQEKSEKEKENGKEINNLMKEMEDILKKMHECINREV